MEMAVNEGISSVVKAFDADDRFAPFTPEIAQTDPQYRQTLEDMNTEDFVQVMRDTIYAFFDGPFPTLGMTEKALKSIHTPAIVMPGSNDVHPRRVAEMVHRLVPNCQWAAQPRVSPAVTSR